MGSLMYGVAARVYLAVYLMRLTTFIRQALIHRSIDLVNNSAFGTKARGGDGMHLHCSNIVLLEIHQAASLVQSLTITTTLFRRCSLWLSRPRQTGTEQRHPNIARPNCRPTIVRLQPKHSCFQNKTSQQKQRKERL